MNFNNWFETVPPELRNIFDAERRGYTKRDQTLLLKLAFTAGVESERKEIVGDLYEINLSPITLRNTYYPAIWHEGIDFAIRIVKGRNKDERGSSEITDW